MTTFSTSRTATVVLGGEDYTVSYEIEGTCWYDPGKVLGPPEDCYPSDFGSDVTRVNVIEVYLDDRELVLSEDLTKRIVAELYKLDLDQFLYEAWSEQGPDDGPDDE